MPGEIWRSQFQIAKEPSYGTDAAATRKMYFDPASRLTRERAPRPHRFATGSRDNVRAFTAGPEMASGSVSMPLSASEIVELLLMGIKGGVTPTTPNAGVSLWTFTPGTSLDSAVIEWDDGANQWQMLGAYASQLRIQGNVREATTVSADLFGKAISAAALTGALASRTPDFIEGWETKLYIDALGATPGTTNIPGELISWDITINNNMARKFFADNINSAEGVAMGQLDINATLLFEAAPAQTDTEFAAWDAQTGRLLRLEFGQNVTIASTYKKFVTVDLPGYWQAFDLGGEDEGTRAYSLQLQYAYDPTNAYGIQVRAQNARAVAWV
jgi:hypothetical protein